MTLFKAAAIVITLSATGASFASASFAETTVAATTISQELPAGDFIKKKKKLKGSYEVVQRGTKSFIVFSEDFRAANGPDLKIFLSPTSVADVTGKTAVKGSINIGELKSTKGVQEYEIPAGVNLSDYASVLVHCEEYAVLWGGSDL
jgi:hypothetical protein